jgi:hypothetical protein
MEYTFNVNTDGLNLDNYEKYLSKFSNWKENKREINLNTLLESNKKIEFEIEMDNSQSVNFVGIVDSESEVQFLEKGCAVIQKLKFIILNNKILILEVTLKTLKTNWGKIIKELIESNIIPELYQQSYKDQIINFYFSSDKILT